MQVARRARQISDANRQWFECYNNRTGARLPRYPESRRASRFWLTTVPHAPKSSRRASPKRPGGPIATCRRPRHLLSPKAQAQGNDGPALGFLGNKGAPLLGDRAPAVFRRLQTICPHRSRGALPHIPPGPPNSTIRSGHSIRRCHHLRTPRWNRCRRNAPSRFDESRRCDNIACAIVGPPVRHRIRRQDAPAKAPRVRAGVSRDQEFESGFLQRRVTRTRTVMMP